LGLKGVKARLVRLVQMEQSGVQDLLERRDRKAILGALELPGRLDLSDRSERQERLVQLGLRV